MCAACCGAGASSNVIPFADALISAANSSARSRLLGPPGDTWIATVSPGGTPRGVNWSHPPALARVHPAGGVTSTCEK